MRVLDLRDDLYDLRGDLASGLQAGVERIELGLGGKVTVHHEKDGLFERRVLGEVVDVVPTVDESPDVTDDVAGLGVVEVHVSETAPQLDLVSHSSPPRYLLAKTRRRLTQRRTP